MRKSTHCPEYGILRQHLVTTRQAAGLSQRELARHLSVTASWVSKVETGERRLDLVEFYWFCSACKKDPIAAAKAVFQTMRREV